MQEIFYFPFISTLCFYPSCFVPWEAELHQLHRLLLTSSWIWPMGSISTWKESEVLVFSSPLTLARLQIGSGFVTLQRPEHLLGIPVL